MEGLANTHIPLCFGLICQKYNFLQLIEEEVKSGKSETTTVSQWQWFE